MPSLDGGLEVGETELLARRVRVPMNENHQQEQEGAHHDPQGGRAGDLLQRGLRLLAQGVLLGGESGGDGSGPRSMAAESPLRDGSTGPGPRWQPRPARSADAGVDDEGDSSHHCPSGTTTF